MTCRLLRRSFEMKPSQGESFDGDPLKATWLPSEAVARAWMQYVKDTAVADVTLLSHQ